MQKENEKVITLIKTTIESEPLNIQIEDQRLEIKQLYNDLIPAVDDADMVFELDKFRNAYEELVKLSSMEAYRSGFKSGVLLFTS